MAGLLRRSLPSFIVLAMAIRVWARGTPMLRNTVESVRSRCRRDTGSFWARWLNTALAMPALPSEFSKSIGLTLWGMADDPTSPALMRCLKYSMDMYIHMSRSRSSMMVLMRRRASHQGGQIVVVRDLGRRVLACDAEAVFQEIGSECRPVVMGKCHVVGVEVARGSRRICR